MAELVRGHRQCCEALAAVTAPRKHGDTIVREAVRPNPNPNPNPKPSPDPSPSPNPSPKPSPDPSPNLNPTQIHPNPNPTQVLTRALSSALRSTSASAGTRLYQHCALRLVSCYPPQPQP